jgi:hypothetical protein
MQCRVCARQYFLLQDEMVTRFEHEAGQGVITQCCFHRDQKRGWTPCAPMAVTALLPPYFLVSYRLSWSLIVL